MKSLLIILTFILHYVENKCLTNPEPYQPPVIDIVAMPRVNWAIVCLYSIRKPGKMDKRNKQLAVALKPYAKKHAFTVLVFSEDRIDEIVVNEWRQTFDGVAAIKTIDTSSNVKPFILLSLSFLPLLQFAAVVIVVDLFHRHHRHLVFFSFSISLPLSYSYSIFDLFSPLILFSFSVICYIFCFLFFFLFCLICPSTLS